MTRSKEKHAQQAQFASFGYRLVYLRPTPYSDERIAVGLVAEADDRLEARFISSLAALDLMSRLLSDDGVEQFQFAAGEMRRALAGQMRLENLSLPTNLLMVGEVQGAFTKDREGLLKNVLASASCLVRGSESKNIEIIDAGAKAQFSDDVFDKVSRLNPLLADQIFHHQVIVDGGKVVQLPIRGKRIYGAAVSFTVRDHRMMAEAYVAKFNWLRKYLPQEPRLYLLAPQAEDRSASSRLDPGLRELQSIAKHVDLTSKVADSTEEIASLILEDEAAA